MFDVAVGELQLAVGETQTAVGQCRRDLGLQVGVPTLGDQRPLSHMVQRMRALPCGAVAEKSAAALQVDQVDQRVIEVSHAQAAAQGILDHRDVAGEGRC